MHESVLEIVSEKVQERVYRWMRVSVNWSAYIRERK